MKIKLLLKISMLLCLMALFHSCSDHTPASQAAIPDSDSVEIVDQYIEPAPKVANKTAPIVEDDLEPQDNELQEPYDVVDGWLQMGVEQAAVIEELGEPEQKGEDTEWGALGTYVQEWIYPSKGIRLNMESATIGASKHVLMITMAAPSNAETSKSISIGSKKADVLNAYSDHFNPDFSDEDQIIIGSIYGGVIFSFESDTVAQIFIGAAAE